MIAVTMITMIIVVKHQSIIKLEIFSHWLQSALKECELVLLNHDGCHNNEIMETCIFLFAENKYIEIEA